MPSTALHDESLTARTEDGMTVLTLLTAILVISWVFPAQAADWDSCAYDLDRAQRAARDASGAAEEAESTKGNFESAKDELQSCLTFPDIYDLMGDQCQSYRWDYESARSSYESALSNLESELDTVDRRLRSVEWSCDYQFSRSSVTGTPRRKKRTPCALYQRYKSSLPAATILKVCRQSMTEAECKKCLGIK